MQVHYLKQNKHILFKHNHSAISELLILFLLPVLLTQTRRKRNQNSKKIYIYIFLFKIFLK